MMRSIEKRIAVVVRHDTNGKTTCVVVSFRYVFGTLLAC